MFYFNVAALGTLKSAVSEYMLSMEQSKIAVTEALNAAKAALEAARADHEAAVAAALAAYQSALSAFQSAMSAAAASMPEGASFNPPAPPPPPTLPEFNSADMEANIANLASMLESIASCIESAQTALLTINEIESDLNLTDEEAREYLRRMMFSGNEALQGIFASSSLYQDSGMNFKKYTYTDANGVVHTAYGAMSYARMAARNGVSLATFNKWLEKHAGEKGWENTEAMLAEYQKEKEEMLVDRTGIANAYRAGEDGTYNLKGFDLSTFLNEISPVAMKFNQSNEITVDNTKYIVVSNDDERAGTDGYLTERDYNFMLLTIMHECYRYNKSDMFGVASAMINGMESPNYGSIEEYWEEACEPWAAQPWSDYFDFSTGTIRGDVNEEALQNAREAAEAVLNGARAFDSTVMCWNSAGGGADYNKYFTWGYNG